MAKKKRNNNSNSNSKNKGIYATLKESITKNSQNNHSHTVIKSELTFGQRAADWVTKWAGSWFFIISLLFLMAVWMFMNFMMIRYRWDPYPFIENSD